MKIISRVTDVLLYASLLTASCAVGLCMATERLISNTQPLVFSQLHMLVFGSVLVVYNVRYVIKWHLYNVGLYGRLRPWLALVFGTGVLLTVISLYGLPAQLLTVLVVLGFLAFAYSWPLLPFKTRKRIRDYGLLKILVLAGVWTIVTSILPMLYHGKSISAYPFEILLRFALLFALCLIFDIRDIQDDRKNNIDTLPNKMGMSNTYRLITTALLVFVVLSVIQYVRHPSPGRLGGALFTALATTWVAGYLRRHPSPKAYLALADGVMMLYALLVLVAGV